MMKATMKQTLKQTPLTLFILTAMSLTPMAWMSASWAEEGHQHEESGGHEAHNAQDKHDNEEHDEQGETDHKHGHDAEEAKAEVTLSPTQQKMIGLQVETLHLQSIPITVQALGEVRRNDYASVSITPKMAGVVRKRHRQLGESVKQGDPLVTIHSEALAQAKAEWILAEQNWRRVQRLGQKVVSQNRYLEAQMQAQVAREKLQNLGLSDKEIRSLKGTSHPISGNRVIRSPKAGVVLEEAFIEGMRVSADQSLLVVGDPLHPWVEAKLTEKQLAQVNLDDTVTVRSDLGRWQAKRLAVEPNRDTDTRLIPVRLQVTQGQEGGVLRPGTFVQVDFRSKALKPALVVPETALLRSPDGDWQVFVAENANTFRSQEVTWLGTYAGQAHISGLPSGSRIVTKGAFFLQSELAKSGFEVHNH